MTDRLIPPPTPNAREWWQALETVHAVTYFAPECRAALADAGARGFWMGYFGSRAAPLGAVDAGVVEAAFFNFHGDMVRRSVPDVWSLCDPPTLLEARRVGAARRALRRLIPSVDDRVLPWLSAVQAVIDGAAPSGRILFAANRGLPWPDDPVEALWQSCTSLREHRGDGHVAALTSAGVDGCEALVLFAASVGIDEGVFLANRGWSPEEWASARRRLEIRGLLDRGLITPSGRDRHRALEAATDELAGGPFAALDPATSSQCYERVRWLARAITRAGVIPFPNPMGLPAPAP